MLHVYITCSCYNVISHITESSRAETRPDGIDALGVATPGVHPALGQEAMLIFGLQVLGRLQPAAPCIVLQVLAMEHGLVRGSVSRHLCCIGLVLGNLPVTVTVKTHIGRRNSKDFTWASTHRGKADR